MLYVGDRRNGALSGGGRDVSLPLITSPSPVFWPEWSHGPWHQVGLKWLNFQQHTWKFVRNKVSQALPQTVALKVLD